MGFNGGVVEDVKVAVVDNIDIGPDVTSAFSEFEKHRRLKRNPKRS